VIMAHPLESGGGFDLPLPANRGDYDPETTRTTETKLALRKPLPTHLVGVEESSCPVERGGGLDGWVLLTGNGALHPPPHLRRRPRCSAPASVATGSWGPTGALGARAGRADLRLGTKPSLSHWILRNSIRVFRNGVWDIFSFFSVPCSAMNPTHIPYPTYIQVVRPGDPILSYLNPSEAGWCAFLPACLPTQCLVGLGGGTLLGP